MKTRVSTVMFALFVVLAVLGGCSSDNSERSRVVCEVQSVNDGAPLISAYINVGTDGVVGGTDDSYPIDAVTVRFSARPYIDGLSGSASDGAYSSFIIHAYDLVWEPGMNAPAGLTAFNVSRGAAQLQVPVFEEAEMSVLVADRALKDGVMTATSDFRAIARLTFYGHDSGSEHEVMVQTSLMVNFIYAVAGD